jgi:hypothetical protein
VPVGTDAILHLLSFELDDFDFGIVEAVDHSVEVAAKRG